MAGQPKPKYEINIEGTEYPWESDSITIAELRTLGSLPADQPVIEVDLKTNEEITLPPDAVVQLKPGQGFSRKVGFKRG